MTAPNYVTLTVDVQDGSGNDPSSGTATFTPNQVLTDPTDHAIIAPLPIVATFRPGVQPTVSLLATDNANVHPSGWLWRVTFAGSNLPTNFEFALPFSGGSTQFLSAQTQLP